MNARSVLGRSGEDLAAARLESDGFEIVDRNYRCGTGEIDLVARRGDLIVFCEVKARSTDYWGQPSEAVGYAKQRRLRKLGALWLKDRRPGPVEVRFDVVSVIFGGTRPEITHIVGAF